MRHPVAGGTGGKASIACRSAPIRSVGAHPNARRRRVFTTGSHCCNWSLKSAGTGERAAGQKRPLQIVVSPFDRSPCASGSPGLQHHHLGAQRRRGTPGSRPVSSIRPARHRRSRPHRPRPGSAAPRPTHSISCHHPANRSSARRVGNSSADSHREYPSDHRQHRQLRRRAGLPKTRPATRDRREPQIALRDLPGDITRPPRRIRRQIHRAQLTRRAP